MKLLNFSLIVSLILAGLLVHSKVTIHLATHTHDDTGWLKTVDQYHYGANMSIQYAGTQYIIESVIQALKKDVNRKFVYVEQAFFFRWWREQDNATKEEVRDIIRQGRLQFANGGWCMHDEAATYYIDMIDQTTLGHRFLKNELNVIPLIGWQIDPFGHSATQAALLSVFSGFLATYHGRLDYQNYDLRCQMKTREFNWRASKSIPYAELLGGVLLYNIYIPPSHFYWDTRNRGGNPIHGDKLLNEYDVPHRVEEFVQHAMNHAQMTLGENIMWTMGSDFNYMDANMWFRNLDQLIKAVNEDGRVRAVYSTPLDYTLAKLQENLNFTTVTDDFFPYEDGPHQFWTGYYTSRPAFKRFVRDMSGFYTLGRQLAAVTARPNAEVLPAMGQAMGLAQHHDAVTGTSKQHVVFDYAQRLNIAKTDMEAVSGRCINDVTGGSAVEFVMCPLANQSECDVTASSLATSGSTLRVVVWNQLAQTKVRVVRIPVPVQTVTVTGSNVQGFQVYQSNDAVTNYGNNNSNALPYTLAVQLTTPSLGFASFNITNHGQSEESRKQQRTGLVGKTPSSVTNGIVTLHFSASTGLLDRIEDVESGVVIAAEQHWCYYLSNVGDSVWGQASGAYIFRPQTNTTCIPIATGSVSATVVSEGPVETVIEQRFSDWMYQRIRLPNGSRHFELEFTVGPIPVADGNGKEVVSKWITNISNQATWYTDSNGREMQKRVRNYRKQWNFTQSEPIAGNYFPVNAMIQMNDDAAELSVLVDASNGGSSVEDGHLELMVHRRLLVDDGRGVAEPLDETEWARSYYGGQSSQFGLTPGFHYGPGLIIRGVHTVSLAPPAKAASIARPLMDEVYAQPRPFFASTTQALSESASFLSQDLPKNVQLTTLELLNSTHLLLRLAHQFGIDEDPTYSLPATVNIQTLFTNVGFFMEDFEEYNLSANQKLSEMVNVVIPPSIQPGTWNVVLHAMEVRTYICRVSLN